MELLSSFLHNTNGLSLMSFARFTLWLHLICPGLGFRANLICPNGKSAHL